MSKASQRRLAAQQKRLRERGPTVTEAAWLLEGERGMDLLRANPMAFWELAGRRDSAGPKHPDASALAEVFDDYREIIEVLSMAFHDPLETACPEGDGATDFGLMILQDFEPIETPVILPFFPWGRDLESSALAGSVLRAVQALPKDIQRQAAIWVFTCAAYPGRATHCLSITVSGAVQFDTLINDTWLRARATRWPAMVAWDFVGAVREVTGCHDQAAAGRIEKHVAQLLGRALLADEAKALSAAARGAFDASQLTAMQLAFESAASLVYHENDVAGQFDEDNADIAKAKPSLPPVSRPAANASPPTQQPPTQQVGSDTARLLKDALARERALSETLQRLRANGGHAADVSPAARPSLRERVSDLLAAG